MKKFKPYNDFILEVGRVHGLGTTFRDFLIMTVCALSAQQQEELYLKTIKKYNKEELNLLCNAFGALVFEMDNKGEGLKDCLGDFYIEVLGNKSNGQFFTPPCITDFMASIVISENDKESLCDPCIGSGRYFLSATKIKRGLYCVGADIDYNCCLMTLINMCLNDICGIVQHRNSLTSQIWMQWNIIKTYSFYPPYIRFCTAEELDKINIKEERHSLERVEKKKLERTKQEEPNLFNNETPKIIEEKSRIKDGLFADLDLLLK